MKSDDNDVHNPSSKANSIPSLDSLLQQELYKNAEDLKPEKPNTPSMANNKKLQDILLNSHDAAPANPTIMRHYEPHKTKTTPDLLHALEKHQHKQHAPTHTDKKITTRHTAIPHLEDVLNNTEHTSESAPQAFKIAEETKTTASLSDALEKTNTSSKKIRPEKTDHGHQYKHWAHAAILLLAVFVTIHSLKHWHNTPNSEIARNLLAVAADIDAYKERNHKLPDHLSELPSFPANAVEWPIENYDVKLTIPKMEFFLVDAPGEYIVIARYANETWVYDNVKAKPLKRVL